MKKKKERTPIPAPVTAPVVAPIASPEPTTAPLAQTAEAAEQKLRESLGQRMGAGYEESTPGLQALAEFKETSEQLKKDVAEGKITQEEAEQMATEEEARIPTGGITKLPVRPSISRASLGDLYDLRTKYKTPKRFTINRYGVVSAE